MLSDLRRPLSPSTTPEPSTVLRGKERQVLVKEDGASQSSEGVESDLLKDPEPEVAEFVLLNTMQNPQTHVVCREEFRKSA